VNNAQYFRWFESARIKYFELVGLASNQPSETGPILAHTECDFLQPLTYPNEIQVCARVISLGRTSFRMNYELAVVQGTTAARGSAVVVLINYQSGAAVPIPANLRTRISDLG
jgi:acyl-CoA thioester hydrolase